MTAVTLAALQMACGGGETANIDAVEAMVRDAAGQGAEIILPQELFSGPYFCKDQDATRFETARTVGDSPAVARLSALAAELSVVLAVSFFERAGRAHFNSLALIDADGSLRCVYRKAHIPDGPGYQEKYYFTPGDTGFEVVETRYGRVGALVCWDQWFPEPARILALQGADVLLYPTAIGSEPRYPDVDSQGHWTRVMQGHAAANMVPVVASNRIGREVGREATVTFYGSSFIAGADGALLAQAGRTERAILTATVDFDLIRRQRAEWGLFRDRRPDLYGALLSHDGEGRR